MRVRYGIPADSVIKQTSDIGLNWSKHSLRFQFRSE